ncbi:MAG: Rid family hydrolase [Sphingomonas fennica]
MTKTLIAGLTAAAAVLRAAGRRLGAGHQDPVEPPGRILSGAKVGPNSEILFLSGQLASPIDPNKKMADIKSVDDFGDSKTQTISTLKKIKELLAAQGYTMADIVKMTLFITADPKTGKMDFAGVNEGFGQFFGTPREPRHRRPLGVPGGGAGRPLFPDRDRSDRRQAGALTISAPPHAGEGLPVMTCRATP